MIKIELGVRSIRLTGKVTIQCDRIFPSQMEPFIRANAPLLSNTKASVREAVVELRRLLLTNTFTLDAFGNPK